MSDRTIKIIPALDSTELDFIMDIIEQIADLDEIYGYKIGFSLGLTYGLPKVVERIRNVSDKPIIYDHQKAATDIPDTGKLFASTLKNAGITEGILFPQAGPITLKAWTTALKNAGLKPIVGGIMTHPGYLESEGGFLKDRAVVDMYRIAIENGVKSFVLPLTKPEKSKEIFDEIGIQPDFEFYSPGLGKQGGDPDKFSFIPAHYLIVGRSLMNANNPKTYIQSLLRR